MYEDKIKVKSDVELVMWNRDHFSVNETSAMYFTVNFADF